MQSLLLISICLSTAQEEQAILFSSAYAYAYLQGGQHFKDKKKRCKCDLSSYALSFVHVIMSCKNELKKKRKGENGLKMTLPVNSIYV